ncbi:NAD(P)-binding protein, partial [Aureobasidium melanogenum]|uniref:NAD(P)-binding protein n=1 Tax=Aureobasidium melanogenum (strain CBS 110374) TaxID=1043003 RepID=A0A074VV99_AURM1
MASSLAPFLVKGKTAIVTGAGSVGINLCFASLLLSRGCNVVFADLGLRPEAKAITDKYSQKSSGQPRAFFQKTDVTNWNQLSKMFKVAQEEFGGTDLVCPGAGVFEPGWSNFWHPPGSSGSKDSVEGDRYASLDINLTHPIRTSQLAISAFLSQQSKATPQNPKRIVMISSVAGQGASLLVPLYHAAKHGVVAFTRSLAGLDDKFGIRVNACCPGIIKTPLWTDNPDKMRYFDEEKDLWATPEEVAEAMLTLVEDEEMVGGTILEIGHDVKRVVPIFNNPGPKGAATSISGSAELINEVYDTVATEGWGKSG